MTKTRAQAEQTAASPKASRATKKLPTGFAPNGAIPIPFSDTMQLGTDAWRNMFETGQDMARFYNTRLLKDFSYLSELGACRSPSQGAAVWARAASEAVHDYADQFDRVMSMTLSEPDGDAAQD